MPPVYVLAPSFSITPAKCVCHPPKSAAKTISIHLLLIFLVPWIHLESVSLMISNAKEPANCCLLLAVMFLLSRCTHDCFWFPLLFLHSIGSPIAHHSANTSQLPTIPEPSTPEETSNTMDAMLCLTFKAMENHLPICIMSQNKQTWKLKHPYLVTFCDI